MTPCRHPCVLEWPWSGHVFLALLCLCVHLCFTCLWLSPQGFLLLPPLIPDEVSDGCVGLLGLTHHSPLSLCPGMEILIKGVGMLFSVLKWMIGKETARRSKVKESFTLCRPLVLKSWTCYCCWVLYRAGCQLQCGCRTEVFHRLNAFRSSSLLNSSAEGHSLAPDFLDLDNDWSFSTKMIPWKSCLIAESPRLTVSICSLICLVFCPNSILAASCCRTRLLKRLRGFPS